MFFLCFLRSGAFRRGPGAILEAPGTLPDQILIRFFIKLYDFLYQIPVGFCDTFLTVASGSCRGLSDFAGVSPGSTSNLSNPLCGVPWGTAISRSDLNSPHPTGCWRGSKRLLSVCRSRKGFPSLPSRRPPQDRRPLPCNWNWRPFFDFFRFFGALKNNEKTDGQKINFFRQF